MYEYNYPFVFVEEPTQNQYTLLELFDLATFKHFTNIRAYIDNFKDYTRYTLRFYLLEEMYNVYAEGFKEVDYEREIHLVVDDLMEIYEIAMSNSEMMDLTGNYDSDASILVNFMAYITEKYDDNDVESISKSDYLKFIEGE